MRELVRRRSRLVISCASSIFVLSVFIYGEEWELFPGIAGFVIHPFSVARKRSLVDAQGWQRVLVQIFAKLRILQLNKKVPPTVYLR